MRRPLIIGLIILILAPVIGYYSAFWWFNSNIDRVWNSTQQEWIIKEISNTPELPKKFYATLEKYYPDFYSENTWDFKLKNLIGISGPKCQCNELYIYWIIPGSTIKKLQKDLGFHLGKVIF